MFQRFVEAVEPRLDQGALVGEPGGQLFGAFGEAAPCVELKMPVERHDIGQEPVEPVPVLNQTLIKMSRVPVERSEEHTSELQSIMRLSYAVFCLKKKTTNNVQTIDNKIHNTENRN